MRYLTNGLLEVLHHDPAKVSDRTWGAMHFVVRVLVKTDGLLTGIERLAKALGK